MKNKLTFALAAILASTPALALDSGRFPRQVSGMLSDAFRFIQEMLRIPAIRQGLTLIALGAILYQVYSAAIKHIRLFHDNVRSISIPLAIISTIAVWRAVKPEILEKLFLISIVILLISWAFRLVIKAANKIRGGFRPQAAKKEQKKVGKAIDNSGKIDKAINSLEGDLNTELKKEKAAEKDEKDRLEQAYKKTNDAQENLKDAAKRLQKIAGASSPEEAQKETKKLANELEKFKDSITTVGANVKAAEEEEQRELQELQAQHSEISKEGTSLLADLQNLRRAIEEAEKSEAADPEITSFVKQEVENIKKAEEDIGKMQSIESTLSQDVIGNQISQLRRSYELTQNIRQIFENLRADYQRINTNIGIRNIYFELEKIKEALKMKIDIANSIATLREKKEAGRDLFEKLKEQKQKYEGVIKEFPQRIKKYINKEKNKTDDLLPAFGH